MDLEEKDAHIYYNLNIEGDGTGLKNASFDVNRVSPILEEPHLYELGVIRFSVPMYNVPILFFENIYSIALQYDTYAIESPLIYNETGIKLYPNKNALWHIGQMVKSINDALAVAFIAIKANTTAPQTQAPFIAYDAKSKLFTIYAQDSYKYSGPTPLRLFFNDELFRLLPTFDSDVVPNFLISIVPENFQLIIIEDTKTNDIIYKTMPYLKMEQEVETLQLWTPLRYIRFETSGIPVRPELISSQNNKITNVITDFEPISGEPSYEPLQFFTGGYVRYYDLLSNYPLSRVDLRIVWVDKVGIEHPFFISKNDYVSVKLVFKKKSISH